MKHINHIFPIYIILNLHLLRNVSTFGYIGIAGLLLIIGIHRSLPNFMSTRYNPVSMWFMLFLGTSVWPTLITFFDYGLLAGVHASGRYFLTLPIVLIVTHFIRKDSDIDKILYLYITIVIIGLLTIPLQYFTGPISWFAEPGDRANVTRFASMLGSLTVAGNVVGLSLFLTLVTLKTGIRKLILTIVLILCGILTLQKAAVMGMPLAILMYFLIKKRSNTIRRESNSTLAQKVLVVCTILGLVTGLSLSITLSPELKQAVSYSIAVFGSDEDYQIRQDLSIAESMEERLITMPEERFQGLVEFKGPIAVLIGGGFGMVGTSLVRENDGTFITSHNGYVDLLLIGGVLHLVAFLGLLGSVLLACTRWAKSRQRLEITDRIPLSLLGVVLLGAVNYLFAGMLTYQPNMSTLFWFAVGCSIGWEKRDNNNSGTAIR